jgi:hypothetical protein
VGGGWRSGKEEDDRVKMGIFLMANWLEDRGPRIGFLVWRGDCVMVWKRGKRRKSGALCLGRRGRSSWLIVAALRGGCLASWSFRPSTTKPGRFGQPSLRDTCLPQRAAFSLPSTQRWPQSESLALVRRRRSKKKHTGLTFNAAAWSLRTNASRS